MYLEVYDSIGCVRKFYFLHCVVRLSCNTMRLGIVIYNYRLRFVVSVHTTV